MKITYCWFTVSEFEKTMASFLKKYNFIETRMDAFDFPIWNGYRQKNHPKQRISLLVQHKQNLAYYFNPEIVLALS